SEAICSRPTITVLPKPLRTDPDLRAELMRLRETAIGSGEQRVSILDLQPGMRLAQPLMAFDGRRVLMEGVRLDRDLIWRIWQLSAIRPLNPAIVCKSSLVAEVELEGSAPFPLFP